MTTETETTDAARLAPEFLLVKRGLYYRPNNCGYTGLKVEAGRYMESEARPADGVTAVHQDEAPEFSKACWGEIKEAARHAKLTDLQAEITRLRAALEKAEERAELLERDLSTAQAFHKMAVSQRDLAWLQLAALTEENTDG